MLIGNGMIANAFYEYIHNDDIIIYASGVSNSSENDIKEFDREFELLKHTIEHNNGKKLIYFSTCSIFDKSVNSTFYVQHKIKMETYIKNICKKYIVFRLPTVIGKTNNNNTFFNYFKNKILNDEIIYIKKNLKRFLIDVDDLKKCLPVFINDDNIYKNIINVCFNNSMKVSDIIKIYELILNKKASIVTIENDKNFYFSNKYFINRCKVNIDNDYNYKILKKYLKNE